MCGITALELEGPDVLLATGMGFAVLFLSEMAHESCRCSSFVFLKTGYFCDQ